MKGRYINDYIQYDTISSILCVFGFLTIGTVSYTGKGDGRVPSVDTDRVRSTPGQGGHSES